ncbi:hypothetical protein, partial [Blautia sp. MB18-30]|uniref:hypothetical protein n=1 Tax=Blautia sp. MB18-30 TaxID=2949744 RepID=UPI00202FD3F7
SGSGYLRCCQQEKIFYRKIIIVSESGQQVFGVIRNLLFLGVYIVVLCKVILLLFTGQCHLVNFQG